MDTDNPVMTQTPPPNTTSPPSPPAGYTDTTTRIPVTPSQNTTLLPVTSRWNVRSLNAHTDDASNPTPSERKISLGFRAGNKSVRVDDRHSANTTSLDATRLFDGGGSVRGYGDEGQGRYGVDLIEDNGGGYGSSDADSIAATSSPYQSVVTGSVHSGDGDLKNDDGDALVDGVNGDKRDVDGADDSDSVNNPPSPYNNEIILSVDDGDGSNIDGAGEGGLMEDIDGDTDLIVNDGDERYRVDDGGGGGSDVDPIPRSSGRGGVIGSRVIWGSEDGVVHMGMRPVHRPRNQARLVARTTLPPTLGEEEAATTSTTTAIDTLNVQELPMFSRKLARIHTTSTTSDVQQLSMLGQEETTTTTTTRASELQQFPSPIHEETRTNTTRRATARRSSEMQELPRLSREETGNHTATTDTSDMQERLPTLSYDETITHTNTETHTTTTTVTPQMQESPSLVPELLTTDFTVTESSNTPEETLIGVSEEKSVEHINEPYTARIDELTSTADERLINVPEDDQNIMPTIARNEGLLDDLKEPNTPGIEHEPTSTGEARLINIPDDNQGDPLITTSELEDLSMVTPVEHLTLPEDWLSSLQGEDDWLTSIPHEEEEELMPTQDFPLSHSSFYLTPTPSSLSPTLSSSITPTLPPSLPPTPSPQEVIEDTLRITTRGLDFLLEASPTTQSALDTTDLPKDDLFTLDLAITTTREGLKVDARDVTFDPSQIAKATSYEGSSYPTATRSATVTTTWVDDEQPFGRRNGDGSMGGGGDGMDSKHRDLKGKGKSAAAVFTSDELMSRFVGRLQGDGLMSEVDGMNSKRKNSGAEDEDSSTLMPDDALMSQFMERLHGNGQASDVLSESSDVTVTNPSVTEDGEEGVTETTTLTDNTQEEQDTTESPSLVFSYETVHATNASGGSLRDIPVLITNITDARNDNSTVRGGNAKVEESVVYEMPVVVARNSGPQLSPSVVVALSVCCAVVVVLAALSVALWVCRRHRNRSKIYLTQEAAKPRAFFTRPMNPAVLPEDSDREDGNTVYMFEFQRPRPPILLGEDQRGIYFIKRDEGTEECRADIGVENAAFSDVPLAEVDEGRAKLDPPKYDRTSKQEDADSGIRVWSSTGSLHAAASPLPTHCRVPPPPYSPSISKESVCLTVHSLPSLPRNSQLFDV